MTQKMKIVPVICLAALSILATGCTAIAVSGYLFSSSISWLNDSVTESIDTDNLKTKFQEYAAAANSCWENNIEDLEDYYINTLNNDYVLFTNDEDFFDNIDKIDFFAALLTYKYKNSAGDGENSDTAESVLLITETDIADFLNLYFNCDAVTVTSQIDTEINGEPYSYSVYTAEITFSEYTETELFETLDFSEDEEDVYGLYRVILREILERDNAP